MAQFVQHFTQDLNRDITVRQGGSVVFNNDAKSTIVEVALFDGSTPYSGGGTVTGAVICPDGSTVPLNNGTLTGNLARVTMTGDCFAIPGQIGVGIMVTSGTIKTTVLKVIYNVELFSTSNPVDPGSRISLDVADLIDDIDTALASIPADYTALKAGVAQTFSADTAYLAGQYVWYNGELYRFKVDHTAGSWNANHAVKAGVGDDTPSMLQLDHLKVGSIPSGADMNDYTAPGNYAVLNGTAANGITHIPEKQAGNLIVLTVTTSNQPVLVQAYLAYTGNLYIRNRSNQPSALTWGEWTKVLNDADVDPEQVADIAEKMASVLIGESGSATQVAENGNINDYIDGGTYTVATDAIAKTLTNLPRMMRGVLLVFRMTGTFTLFQLYITQGSIWKRTHIQGREWGQWIAAMQGQNNIPAGDHFAFVPSNFVNQQWTSANHFVDNGNRACHVQKLNDGSVVLFPAAYSATYFVLDPTTYNMISGFTAPAQDTSGRMVIDTQGIAVDYIVCVQIMNRGQSSVYVDCDQANLNVTILNRDKTVDLMLFAGQSNMAGRGSTETAPALIPCAGLEFRAISDNTRLYPISEPFGVAENKSGGINDGTAKTGDMVTAFANAYFEQAGVPIVGVSASVGGKALADWKTTGSLLPDAIQRLTDAQTYLSAHGYTVRHTFMIWLQGESDGNTSSTSDDDAYNANFAPIWAAVKAAGAEKCLLIRIGESNGAKDFGIVIKNQTLLAQTNPDVVMISTLLASYKRRGYMKDEFHFFQDAYNEFGTDAGINAAFYANTGKEPVMYDPKYNNVYTSKYSATESEAEASLSENLLITDPHDLVWTIGKQVRQTPPYDLVTNVKYITLSEPVFVKAGSIIQPIADGQTIYQTNMARYTKNADGTFSPVDDSYSSITSSKRVIDEDCWIRFGIRVASTSPTVPDADESFIDHVTVSLFGAPINDEVAELKKLVQQLVAASGARTLSMSPLLGTSGTSEEPGEEPNDEPGEDSTR